MIGTWPLDIYSWRLLRSNPPESQPLVSSFWSLVSGLLSLVTCLWLLTRGSLSPLLSIWAGKVFISYLENFGGR